MDIVVIKSVQKAFINHTLSFPEGIGKLITAGVQWQYVDFIQMLTTSYSADNNYFVSEIAFNEKVFVADTFNAEAIKQAIKLSQEQNLPFFDFYKTSVNAGCIGYHIFIAGKKVVYYGRKGESHTEFFPQ
ncbi:MAG: DUF1398 domain-containing protein [Alphaproteobacteria bacterium]|jgi:uncharacterized protein YbcV (DUF1398 family)|nr:DUF1398 domain-containing protein [Alphaproteobacteria bacterium]